MASTSGCATGSQHGWPAGRLCLGAITRSTLIDVTVAHSLAGVEVRPARPGDEDALRALRLRALAEAPEAFSSTLEREAARPATFWRELAAGERGLCLLALDGGEAVGLAGALPDGDVWGMWVAPEARRAGAGRALLTAIEVWARTRELDRLSLRVSEAAPAARALYRAAGFAEEGAGRPLRSNPALRTFSLRLRL